MRFLIVFVIVISALWGGYWFVGSSAKQSVITSWLEDRKSGGWTVEYSDFDVLGFPSRFDSQFTDIELASPRTGVSWSAPFFQILALSYKPNHIVAVWPHEQTISTAAQDIAIKSEDMRASVKFAANTGLALERLTMRTKALALEGGLGWRTDMDTADFTFWETIGKDDHYNMNISATNLTPATELRRKIDPENTLPSMIEKMLLDTELEFSAPWDRSSFENGYPALLSFVIKDLTAIWGDLELRATGTVNITESGYPEGAIEIQAHNWRDMLGLAVSTGAIDADTAGDIETGLEFLTQLSGKPEQLNIPLTFANRQIALGPIILGPAPRLR